jgi:uncharacterized membrane protein YjgN (DUF898 family)
MLRPAKGRTERGMNDIDPQRAFGQRHWQRAELEFSGSSGEYFRIWTVNLLLSIATLGIYSAWAKVRRLRYFYGNTYLDGHNFDYHANPVRILIGRIIVVGALFVMNILSNISPWFLLLLLPYLAALPWIINQSLAFNAQMTSYRNVRLSFHGSYFPALGVYVLMPLVSLLSVGLLAPVASRLLVNYTGSRLRFGTAAFATRARLGPLYANLLVCILFMLLAIAAIFVVIILAFGAQPPADSGEPEPIVLFIIGAVVYAAFFLVFYLYRAGVRNVAFSATTLQGGHQLGSNLSRLRYLWIMLSNAVMVVCSLGLLWPVAAVRTWRYLMNCTQFHSAGPLDGFVGEESRKSSAAAAEYLDLGGIDFGV